MQKVINNLAIEYSIEGSGPTILMLHGWGDNLDTFDNLSKQLKENYKVVRFDFPGFGNSQPPKNDWHLNDYINQTQQFIEKLDIDVDILLGHSFGGRVIIKGVAENILEANKIILISSAGIYKGNSLKNKAIKAVAKTGKAITSFIPGKEKIRRIFYKAINSDFYEAGEMKETFLNIIQEDLQNYAKKIKQPTLLIWGENDDITPIKDGYILNKIIPKSEFKTIENGDHFIHQKNPEKITKLINNFNV